MGRGAKSARGAGSSLQVEREERGDGGSAPAARATNCAVCDRGAIFENTETVADDDGIVDEDILFVRADDEAKAFSGIKPLDDTLGSGTDEILGSWL